MSSINFYRSDGWVKTTQGPAVPGAQVYILTQPANVVAPITPPRTTPVPFVPNPQAQIYSDSGNTPIVQPIITDGFGHYNFYVLPGLYTVAIYYGGKLQNYYVDQSIGNIGSSSGSSVVFETNGSPNFNQLLQNLVQGAGIVISTDNLGNTTFSVNSSTIIINSSSIVTPVNTQTSSYVAQLGDLNGIVEMGVSTACTFTVPPNSSVAFPVGSTITVNQLGAGQVTLTAGAGVTILTPYSLTTRVQYSTVSVIKIATDTWMAAGDLT